MNIFLSAVLLTAIAAKDTLSDTPIKVMVGVLITFSYFIYCLYIAPKLNISPKKKKVITIVVAVACLVSLAIIMHLPVLSTVFAIIVFSVCMLILFAREQAKNKRHNETNKKSGNRVEQLAKLKELLDCGAITQEEFDEKKKQILGL